MFVLRLIICGVAAATISTSCLKAVNAVPEKKARQLVAAAETGNVQLCGMLVKKKDVVNKRDASRRTPLIAAAAEGHVEAVRTLLDAGADIEKEGPRGRTALMKPC
ncbi:MAG: ankyrin repeat domain-containing protein [bacterium]